MINNVTNLILSDLNLKLIIQIQRSSLTTLIANSNWPLPLQLIRSQAGHLLLQFVSDFARIKTYLYIIRWQSSSRRSMQPFHSLTLFSLSVKYQYSMDRNIKTHKKTIVKDLPLSLSSRCWNLKASKFMVFLISTDFMQTSVILSSDKFKDTIPR